MEFICTRLLGAKASFRIPAQKTIIPFQVSLNYLWPKARLNLSLSWFLYLLPKVVLLTFARNGKIMPNSILKSLARRSYAMNLKPIAGIDVSKYFSEMVVISPTNEILARLTYPSQQSL